MSAQADANAKVIAAHQLHHSGILGIGEANTTQVRGNLKTKRSHLTQLLHDLRWNLLLSVVTSCVVGFLGERREI